jgi:hypothetical protein
VSRRELAAAGALLALGLTQMIAQLAGSTAVRALAAATNASPAPKVFSAVSGLETYSTTFHIDWSEADGSRRSQRLTSEIYARLRGPYNRRNVYGAVLAFGPVMASNPATAPMFNAVLRASLCGDRAVLRELGFQPERMTSLRVRLEPLRPEALGALPRSFEPDCR